MDDGAFCVRSIHWKDTSLVNVCDRDLVGKTVTEGKLSIHISREYFGGEIVGPSEALRLIKTSAIVNLAGQNVVQIAVENKLAAKEAVRIIDRVPFLMIYKFIH